MDGQTNQKAVVDRGHRKAWVVPECGENQAHQVPPIGQGSFASCLFPTNFLINSSSDHEDFRPYAQPFRCLCRRGKDQVSPSARVSWGVGRHAE